MSTLKVNRIEPRTGDTVEIVGLDIPDPLDSQQVKAWVRFNAKGTVEIQASKNVSSVTDNGVGDYTVNYINPMPDNYYMGTCTGDTEDGRSDVFIIGFNEGSIRVRAWTSSTLTDVNKINIAVIRD